MERPGEEEQAAASSEESPFVAQPQQLLQQHQLQQHQLQQHQLQQQQQADSNNNNAQRAMAPAPTVIGIPLAAPANLANLNPEQIIAAAAASNAASVVSERTTVGAEATSSDETPAQDGRSGTKRRRISEAAPTTTHFSHAENNVAVAATDVAGANGHIGTEEMLMLGGFGETTTPANNVATTQQQQQQQQQQNPTTSHAEEASGSGQPAAPQQEQGQEQEAVAQQQQTQVGSCQRQQGEAPPVSDLPLTSSLQLQTMLLQSQLQQLSSQQAFQLTPQQLAVQQQYLQQAAIFSGLNPAFAQTLALQQQLQQQQATQLLLSAGHAHTQPVVPGGGDASTGTGLLSATSVVAAPAVVATPGTTATAVADNSALTGRIPLVLYMSCDDDALSEYQCLVRKNIELFEAVYSDVESNAQGRNRPIVLGQVGIRCRHCVMLPPKNRARGAVYYPAKLEGLYQAAQNQANGHLAEHCSHMPPAIREELLRLKDRKSSAGGGKKYWADGVRVLGVFEDAHGLRFERR